MNLILSEYGDKVTDNVIEWLLAGGREFMRVDDDLDMPARLSINLSDHAAANGIRSGHYELDFSRITSVWHRRGRFNFLSAAEQRSSTGKDLLLDQKRVNFFLEKYLSADKRYIGSYQQEVENNKLEDLLAAQQAGLSIPDTLVCNNREDLAAFISKHNTVAVKLLSAVFEGARNSGMQAPGTRLLREADLQHLPAHFGLSLFQQYVEKQLELRIFFFEDRFFPMAIFSQQDEQTRFDYRHYNEARPNRNVPYLLPESILEQLKHFNKLQGYTTGSFDIILTPKDQYCFLELNPTSQFHGLSATCNYYIEKHIAQQL